ncbi:E3 ubiquitin-protein ligase RNF31-like isoform X2 [Denticeps clupeoides]|uniref:E3 ubiquitin-protein ligase RNF31-like isoform X2 n=1 Tax=Denticeps clupeoides TaxID=299321 RepID=UPI0010A3E08D|nr:E3 ubiquitin-protein ligase RNF31-like isoform X2 [Denticeps clupeoides]
MTIQEEYEEVRRRVESHLLTSSSAHNIGTDLMAVAGLPLPFSAKYRHLAAESMVLENGVAQSRHEVLEQLGRLMKALNMLEKYGRNLINPNRPQYWRSVKDNNPVFRNTVDAVKGGRVVLSLYGYTAQLPDGVGFPDDTEVPDVRKVAAVMVEVMMLRAELDMLIKGTHPHPEVFERTVPKLRQQKEGTRTVPDAVVIPAGGKRQAPPTPPKPKFTPNLTNPTPRSPTSVPGPAHPPAVSSNRTSNECNVCGGAATLRCPACGSLPFCDTCDVIYHRHPGRADHRRDPILERCPAGGVSAISSHRAACTRPPGPPEVCERVPVGEFSANEGHVAALRATSGRPRPGEDSPPPSATTEWKCQSCTVLNPASGVLCQVCERPRLATRPPAVPARRPPAVLPAAPEAKWTCEHCTFDNRKSAPECEMCTLPRPQPVSIKDPPTKPKATPQDLLAARQMQMKEDGLQLVQRIREGEKRGVSPEEVCAALSVSRDSAVSLFDWIESELPRLLDEICAMAASVQQTLAAARDTVEVDGGPEDLRRRDIQLSRAEAKQAWLAAGGDVEKSVQQLLKSRRAKMRELSLLGFRNRGQCEEALRLSGGDVSGALTLLQRPLLETFHQRVWANGPEVPIDPGDPDKQRTCRRLLALYDLPSWGRCELALCLLQESNGEYCLEDVIEAVRDSPDRDIIRRMLSNECRACFCNFPASKMRSLTSCQCLVCCECFKNHFTVAVRDKHIRDMVCPGCDEPDINDPEFLDNYFSTLDIQLRDCMEKEVYELFHKKLTEHALMKDPKFLWCTHCTNGFIYDGNQCKVTCQSCRGSFCSKCQKPWEEQHEGLSCEQFQLWKRENDPEYQRLGLAGYLHDNGIGKWRGVLNKRRSARRQ